MEIMIILGLITVLGLSYWNGANDVSKTISTIVGGRVGNYKKAVVLGAAFNAIGTFLALFFAQAIFKVFTSGFLKEPDIQPVFVLALLAGAIGWLIFATKTGLPVSTTHSLIGAVLFLGLYVFSFSGIKWMPVLLKVALPLLISPLVSFVLAFSIFWFFKKRTKKMLSKNFLNCAHWVSCAASSFARGMNDGPKFVALAAIFLIANAIDPANTLITPLIFVLVALTMAIGGLIEGQKVTKKLSFEITKMNHKDGFAANLITALLVTAGAYIGLPMSTTHVSSCAIIGVGSTKGKEGVYWKTVKQIFLAWVITLPASGIFAIISYMVFVRVIM